MEQILDTWVQTNQILVKDIPTIAEAYIKYVHKENCTPELVQKLMQSGIYQMMAWNQALRDIAVCMGYNLEILYGRDGNLLKRYHTV